MKKRSEVRDQRSVKTLIDEVAGQTSEIRKGLGLISDF